MATVRTFPFDAVNGNPSYGAVAMRDVIEGIVSTGVVNQVDDALQVVASTPNAMTVEIKPGLAYIKGAVFRIAAGGGNQVLSVPSNTSGSTRQDYVVLRFDLTTSPGNITAVYKAGTTSPPSLTRTSTQYEIALAQVAVANNATAISQANITDKRGDQNLCGWAITPAAAPTSLLGLPGMTFQVGTLKVLSLSANGTYTPPSGYLGLIASVQLANNAQLTIGATTPTTILQNASGADLAAIPLTLPVVCDPSTPVKAVINTVTLTVWEVPQTGGVAAWYQSVTPSGGTGTITGVSGALVVVTRAYFVTNADFTIRTATPQRAMYQAPTFLRGATPAWVTGYCGYWTTVPSQTLPADPLPWPSNQPLLIPPGASLQYVQSGNISITLAGYTVPSGWTLSAS